MAFSFTLTVNFSILPYYEGQVPHRNLDMGAGPDKHTERWGEVHMDILTAGLLAAVIIVIISLSLKIVKQYERGVVFRLGKVIGVREPGLRIIIPIIDRMVRVSLRIVTMPIPSQKIITQDNVSIDVAAVAYFKVADPLRAVVAIEDYYGAVNQISQTTVRNVIGQFVLDEVLSETARINEKIKEIIDEHSEPWGINVTTVEIKDIKLPEGMQRAMARQAEAERDKRAKIITAEGEYFSAAKLGEAADVIEKHPVALQLRNLQVLAEIATEKNSTIVFPAQFMSSIRDVKEFIEREDE
ncbi:stomatin-like protein [Methanothermobacter thermautotrophicus str. Delta H]|uniref:Stomatin-like protein n=2 Tax=Methanothermobacter thermautotrophicus TaxID=145262 RepID=O27808_METTH|nr:stomatin-like protein [Methanothermobacter thermautotrophicus str. Delta H]